MENYLFLDKFRWAKKGRKSRKGNSKFKIQNSKFASFFTGNKKDTREKRMDRKAGKAEKGV